jgi:hypothetical protein
VGRIEFNMTERTQRTEIESSVYKFHISLGEQIIHHLLILSNRHGTGTVNHKPSTLLTLVIQSINRGHQQLLLQMSAPQDLRHGPLDLDAGIARNDTQPAAGGVEQYPIEGVAHLHSDLASVVAASDNVPHTQTVQVGDRGLLTFGFQIVGDDHAFVAHQLRYV